MRGHQSEEGTYKANSWDPKSYNWALYQPQYWQINGISLPNTIHAIWLSGHTFTQWLAAHPGYDPLITGSVTQSGTGVPSTVTIPTGENEPPVTETPAGREQTDKVEVLSVSLAADGGFIMIRFLAPVKVAERWWQGSVSVLAEDDGATYNEIPVMPKLGPLVGRPAQDGQPGYVMLVNLPPGLQAGDLVTVLLGNYRFEHVPVE